ncbi:MAG: hypothetical protein NTW14_10235 [bacterium]|nr:hypothetical protein [bacterium]
MNKKTTNYLVTAILILGMMLFLASCSEDDSGTNSNNPPAGQNSSSMTPQAGGSVAYENGAVTVPPGALNDTTEISVGIPASAPNYTHPANTAQVGAAYEFGPDGTTFLTPVTVTLEYDQASIGSNNEATLKIYTFTDANPAPVQLGNIQVHEDSNYVTGTTTHFSYCVLIIASGSEPPGDIPENPQGGNLTGNWTFSSLEVENIDTDTFKLSMSGTGEGFVNITATEWEEELTMTTTMQAEYYIGMQWVVVDTTFTEYEHLWGTYTIQENVRFVATVTEADPDNQWQIGNTRTDGYTAESNRLIFYQKTYGSGDYNMWVIYTK